MGTLKQLMDADPKTIYQQQHDALINHIEDTFNNVLTQFKRGNYQTIIDRMMCDSPAGDGYGEDNMYINFGFEDGDDFALDFADVLSQLIRLRKKIDDA